MKYIAWETINGQTAFIGKVNENCWKAGIENRVTSGYRTQEEAQEAYEHYKKVIGKDGEA